MSWAGDEGSSSSRASYAIWCGMAWHGILTTPQRLLRGVLTIPGLFAFSLWVAVGQGRLAHKPTSRLSVARGCQVSLQLHILGGFALAEYGVMEAKRCVISAVMSCLCSCRPRVLSTGACWLRRRFVVYAGCVRLVCSGMSQQRVVE